MNEIDDVTNEPINVCSRCKKEIIGWVDNPEEDFICEDCI